MVVVYLCRKGDRNEELRHSLRSLANLDHGEVWIVGYRPSWVVGVRHLPVDQCGSKAANTLAAFRALADRGPDEFTLFNDDMFVMQPLAEVPVWHDGPIDGYIDRVTRRAGAHSTYARRAVATRDALVKVGLAPETLLSYELHVPMPMRRDALAAALAALDPLADLVADLGWFAKRSAYGNLARIGGTRMERDCKIHSDERWDEIGWETITTWPIVSTSDASFRYAKVGRWLRRRFPRPSPYER